MKTLPMLSTSALYSEISQPLQSYFSYTFLAFNTLKHEIHIKISKFSLIMKNGVFWDVMPCGSCKNRRFGGT
jgi:hypothetical protein